MPYVDEGLFVAALFSDFEAYKCGAKKLAERISVVGKSYRSKAEKLESPGCRYPFNELDMLNGNATIGDYYGISYAASILEQKNKDLAKNGCEVLY
jgi:hypothetical protein